MKSFESQYYYERVADRGMCPRCHTLITKTNLIDVRQSLQYNRHNLEVLRFDPDILRIRRQMQMRIERMNEEAILFWLKNMRLIDDFMCSHKKGGFAFIMHKPAGDLEQTINILEAQICQQLKIALRGPSRQLILEALKNEIIINKKEGVQSNNGPLLVFRFFTGTRPGLYASCQGAIGQGEAQQPWRPEHERGTVTKSAKMHQRGVKKSTNTSGRRSDVISTTCSLRNLVKCSAGCYSCTPGGQVVPIIFGMEHIGIKQIIEQYRPMWAPFVALILIPPGSYVCDWSPFLVDMWSESTAKDVSFFEREVTYDTYGGNLFLCNELIIGIWPNPFKGKIFK